MQDIFTHKLGVQVGSHTLQSGYTVSPILVAQLLTIIN